MQEEEYRTRIRKTHLSRIIAEVEDLPDFKIEDFEKYKITDLKCIKERLMFINKRLREIGVSKSK